MPATNGAPSGANGGACPDGTAADRLICPPAPRGSRAATAAMAEAAMDARAEDVRAEHEAVARSLKDAVAHALQAGKLLLEAKAALPHGGFGSWLEKHVRLKPRTAQAYMQLARELPKLPKADAQRVADLPLRAALAELPRVAGKIAKLPEPAATRALDLGRENWRELKAAASRETLNTQVLESRRESRKEPWVTALAPPQLPPAPDGLVAGILAVVRAYWREEMLEALNEAYCSVQDGALAAGAEAAP